MIATLSIKVQYGRNTQAGVNLMPQLDGKANEMFAHSTQDALEWAKKFPLFQDAIIDDLADGCYVISSQWLPRDTSMDILFETNEEWKQAEYIRQQITIYPRNTIYENVGFQVK